MCENLNVSECAMVDQQDHSEAVEELRTLLRDEEDLYVGHPADEKVLMMFLRFTDFNVNKAFEKMKSVYGLKAENSCFYAYKRDPDNHDDILKIGMTQILDYRDQRGRRIYVVKTGQMKHLDMRAHQPWDMSQTDDLWICLAMDEPETQVNGLVVILDLAGFPWSFVRYFSPAILRLSSAKSENRAVKHVQYHVVNGGMILGVFMTLVYPFLSQSTKEETFFHKNYESLHRHISPECLPKEYGGERPAIDSQRLIHDYIDAQDARLRELLSYGYPPILKD